MDLFTTLGFHWARDAVPATLPTHSRERVCFRFHRMLPEFVWDASMLEGNPFTFPEVKTLLDGVTVGGRRLSDQDQVLNLAESSRHLLGLVRSGTFTPDKATFCALQGIVARREAREWGHFRGEGDETAYTPDGGLGAHGRYTPLPTVAGAPELRSSRLMMNGILMSAGIDAISIPAASAQEFNETMVQFYLTREGSGMMAFLLGCHPEGSRRPP